MTLSPDIEELFELLLQVPVKSNDPDDAIARFIFMNLLRRRLAERVN